MYDSVQVFAEGLSNLERSHALRPANISCEMEHPWDGGLSLINYINSVVTKGISGPIEFKEGRRILFKLDLLKLKQHSLVKVGEWRPGAGVNVTDTATFFEPGSANVTLLVITILVSPIHSLSIPLRYVIHPYVESREASNSGGEFEERRETGGEIAWRKIDDRAITLTMLDGEVSGARAVTRRLKAFDTRIRAAE
ncbi:Glutamate receptor, ionotropic kainate 3 [Eufriesea mexicana]|uniref:Glutamate receptor, ionotropic kainate 3 n=1 Tax=Eufriesea mexicana TaxID=516756 RepID=A0A310SL83_9HYME|nr:Glutamate receptor, ionotropic kainate 3 [Eufriesea mexicana]